MSSDAFLDALRKKAFESNSTYLKSAEEGLIIFKKRPKAGLKMVMSAVHGLKGDLGALGYTEGQQLVHELESVLTELEPKITSLKEEDLQLDQWSTLSFSLDDALSGIHQYLLLVKDGGDEPVEAVRRLNNSFGLLKLFMQPSLGSTASDSLTDEAKAFTLISAATSQAESIPDVVPDSMDNRVSEEVSPFGSKRFFLICAVGRYEYALPIDSVREVIKCRDIQNLPVPRTDILGLITLRGETLPVFNLPRRLAIRHQIKPEIMVICQIGDRRIALPMDRADKVLELDEADFQSIAKANNSSEGKAQQDAVSAVRKIWVHNGHSTLCLEIEQLVA